MKIQQRDNRNSVAGKSETNAHDYSFEAQDNYEQNLSSAFAKQPLILGYSSATPNNHQQNSSPAIINQSFILGYSSATPDNAANKPLVLTSFILGTCQILIPYYCGIPTYSMLLRSVVNEMI